MLTVDQMRDLSSSWHDGKVVVLVQHTDDSGRPVVSYTVRRDGFEPPDERGESSGDFERLTPMPFTDQPDDPSVLAAETGTPAGLVSSCYRLGDEPARRHVELVSGPDHLYAFLATSAGRLVAQRFVLDGTTNRLHPAVELRFRVSGERRRAAGAADRLSSRDVTGRAFTEPAVELGVVGPVDDGPAVTLLRTEVGLRWLLLTVHEGVASITSVACGEDGWLDLTDGEEPGVAVTRVSGPPVTGRPLMAAYDVQGPAPGGLVAVERRLMVALPSGDDVHLVDLALTPRGVPVVPDDEPTSTVLDGRPEVLAVPTTGGSDLRALLSGSGAPASVTGLRRTPDGRVEVTWDGHLEAAGGDAVELTTLLPTRATAHPVVLGEVSTTPTAKPSGRLGVVLAAGLPEPLDAGTAVVVVGSSGARGRAVVAADVDAGATDLELDPTPGPVPEGASRLLLADAADLDVPDPDLGRVGVLRPDVPAGRLAAVTRHAAGLRITAEALGVDDGEVVELGGARSLAGRRRVVSSRPAGAVLDDPWPGALSAHAVPPVTEPGAGLLFDGAGAELRAPVLLPSPDHVVEAWLRVAQSVGALLVLEPDDPDAQMSPGGYWSLGLDSEGHAVLTRGDGTVLAGDRPLDDAAWHHIAVSFSGLTAALVVDGTVDTSLTLDAELGDWSDAGARLLRVGNLDVTGVTDVDVADLRVWGVARTADEVAATRGGGGTAPQPDLVGWWPCRSRLPGQRRVAEVTGRSVDADLLGSVHEGVCTLPTRTGDGTPIEGYADERLVPVVPGRWYTESIEVQVPGGPTASGLPTLTYRGVADRTGGRWHPLDGDDVEAQPPIDLGDGWTRLTCRFRVPAGSPVRLVRCLELGLPASAGTPAVRIRNHVVEHTPRATTRHVRSLDLSAAAEASSGGRASDLDPFLDLGRLELRALVLEHAVGELAHQLAQPLTHAGTVAEAEAALAAGRAKLADLRGALTAERADPLNRDSRIRLVVPAAHVAVHTRKDKPGLFWSRPDTANTWELLSPSRVNVDNDRHLVLLGVVPDDAQQQQQILVSRGAGGMQEVGTADRSPWPAGAWWSLRPAKEGGWMLCQGPLVLWADGRPLDKSILRLYPEDRTVPWWMTTRRLAFDLALIDPNAPPSRSGKMRTQIREARVRAQETEVALLEDALAQVRSSGEEVRSAWSAGLAAARQSLAEVRSELALARGVSRSGVTLPMQPATPAPQAPRVATWAAPGFRPALLLADPGAVELVGSGATGRILTLRHDSVLDGRPGFGQWTRPAPRPAVQLGSAASRIEVTGGGFVLGEQPEGWTVELWFFHAPPPPGSGRVRQGLLGGPVAQHCTLVHEGDRHDVESVTADGTRVVLADVSSLAPGWHHLALRASGVGPDAGTALALDGRPVGEIAVGHRVDDPVTVVGGRDGGPDAPASGAVAFAVAELRVWAEALRRDEVESAAMAGVTGEEPGLAAWYVVEAADEAAATLHDHAGTALGPDARVHEGIWVPWTGEPGSPGAPVGPAEGSGIDVPPDALAASTGISCWVRLAPDLSGPSLVHVVRPVGWSDLWGTLNWAGGGSDTGPAFAAPVPGDGDWHHVVLWWGTECAVVVDDRLVWRGLPGAAPPAFSVAPGARIGRLVLWSGDPDPAVAFARRQVAVDTRHQRLTQHHPDVSWCWYPGPGVQGGTLPTADLRLPVELGAVTRCEQVEYTPSPRLTRCWLVATGGGVAVRTGHRVDDVDLDYVGTAPLAPTLLGYIEGAPPVPSENLTGAPHAYLGGSSVELRAEDEVRRSWTRSASTGVGGELEAYFGLNLDGDAGFAKGEAQVLLGGQSADRVERGWTSAFESVTGTVRTDRLQLVGSIEAGGRHERLGARFVPKNVGYALVSSGTADVYATRLRGSGRSLGFVIRPRDGDEPEVSTITFLMNPAYVMNGSLDGYTGTRPTSERYFPDLAQMRRQLGSAHAASYLRVEEDRALRAGIAADEALRTAHLAQYSEWLERLVADAGASTVDESDLSDIDAAQRLVEILAQTFRGASLPPDHLGRARERWEARLGTIRRRAAKRDIANRYVWDADGGLRTESERFAATVENHLGTVQTSTQSSGLDVAGKFSLGGVGGALRLQTLATTELSMSWTAGSGTSSGFALDVDLSGIERTGVTDRDDVPLSPGEKVDRYRFSSYYLAGAPGHLTHFFDEVVDPRWLRGNGSEARALRAVNRTRAVRPWRVLHRVTSVERPLLPDDGLPPPPSGTVVARAAAPTLDEVADRLDRLQHAIDAQGDVATQLAAVREQLAALEDLLPPARGDDPATPGGSGTPGGHDAPGVSDPGPGKPPSQSPAPGTASRGRASGRPPRTTNPRPRRP